DQAPRRAAPRDHPAALLEAERLVLLRDEVVLRDLHVAVDDALDAPDAGVIVQRRLLIRPPRHHYDRVLAVGVAVQQAAGVAAFHRPGVARRHGEAARAEGIDQHRLDQLGHLLL